VDRCLNQVSSLLAKKLIAPIQPIHTFAAGQITEAFKYMQEGKHTGKIIVEMPDDTRKLPISKAPSHISFCNDGAYLLVGGLGGLGRAVAQWMVENGARHLVFLSRTAGASDNDANFVHDLELQGCHPLLIPGDVAKLADVKRAVAASCKPMKGVIHMAMLMKVSHYLSQPDISEREAHLSWYSGLSLFWHDP
jgi:hypothetical protein